jgi:hypothetical protein
LLKHTFFETIAPIIPNLVLLLEMAMGGGLLVGAWLARKGRFRPHAWCQSAIVLLNLAVIAVMMIPSFRVRVFPRIPAKLGKAYYALATGHAALGSATEIARVVHPARSGHEPFASKIPDHEIQEMDAKRSRALLGCAAAGNGDLHALVCPHLFPN